MLFRIAILLLANAGSIFAGAIDFSRDIQPILSENCYHCHGPDAKARKAELRLDQKEGAMRSQDGVKVVKPGDSKASELIARIFTTDADDVMPPVKSNRVLTVAQKELLRRWVDDGAKWGEHWAFVAPLRTAVPTISDFGFRISGWKKREPARTEEIGKRETALGQWPKNAIDHFTLDRLLAEGLAPSPEATPEKLCRRLYLDLTGLPPTPGEVDAFVKAFTAAGEEERGRQGHKETRREGDTETGLAASPPRPLSPKDRAVENLADRLLASPRYGERMVWEWLEAARYADTNGYQGDPTRAMWYWRDWAIGAFNANMPFDKFTIEQIAGDLLPDPARGQLIATGFHRNHMINGEGGRIAEESRVDYVQDRVETTGTVWLGLTFNCCRCHDHKFDPILQREYYQLAAYFNSIEESGANDSGGLAKPILSLASPEQDKELAELDRKLKEAGAARSEIEKRLRAVQSAAVNPKAKKNPELAAADKIAESAKKARADFEKAMPRTMIMRERAEPRDTFILVKGAYNQYADKVAHGVPAKLPPLPADATKNRLALARWLVAPENPLTARVTVNRLWQQFFGTGIVKTADNFGVQSDAPSHPELLDWLAVDFRESGWDVKRMVRLVVTSATYRQESGAGNQKSEVGGQKSEVGGQKSEVGGQKSEVGGQKSEVGGQKPERSPGASLTSDLRFPTSDFERDPENRLLARGPRHRLPSWMLRDQALAVSGLLVEKVGGPPVKTYQPPGVWEDATFGQIKFSQDHGEALYRRSLYIFWRRIVAPTVFFDVANRQGCSVKTGRTNTPLHALITMNDITFVEAARALAQRTLLAPGDDAARIAVMFRRCTARLPSENESRVLLERLRILRETYREDGDAAQKLLAVGESKADASLPAAELAAWTGIATIALNLDETLSSE